MNRSVRRRRAAPMAPEQRRLAIIDAVLPLIVEHGGSVTTSQIAERAGIAEGTVFRVFRDKSELIAACVARALEPDDVVAGIASIPRHLPLPEQLLRAVAAMKAHRDRVVMLTGHLHRSGDHGEDPGPHADRHGDSADAFARIGDAVAAIFASCGASLRAEPGDLAAMFISLVIGRRYVRSFSAQPLDDLVTVFLAGAVTDHQLDVPGRNETG